MQGQTLALLEEAPTEENHHSWCMLCGMRSKSRLTQRQVREWCTDHFQDTGHARYREVAETYVTIGVET